MQTYIRELLRTLPHAVDAELVAAVQADAVGELAPEIRPRTYPVAAGVRRALAGLRFADHASLVHGLDATIPVASRVPRVVTFHDLSVFDVPWTFTRRRAVGKRLQARHAVRAADAIIAVSAFTAERLRSRFGVDAVVIHEAPSPDCAPPLAGAVADVRERYELPERFVLHVGALEPRKDVPGLARACESIGAALVLAGPDLAARAGGLKARLLGYVPQADLGALYAAAAVVAFPSRYEGFGLPPLEAMACGAPVVASRAGSLPEVLGDAARLVPAGDVDALARALADVLADEGVRAELSAAGLDRARQFSWETTARLTADVYRSLGLAV